MRNVTYLIGLLVLAGVVGGCSSEHDTKTTATTRHIAIAGADTDEHGCKGSAGYQWSVVQQKCVQLSETGIQLTPIDSGNALVAYVLFASPDNDQQAEVFLPGEPRRILLKNPGEESGTWTLDTLTLNQWKGMYSLNGAKGTILYESHSVPESAFAAAATTTPAADVPALLQGRWQAQNQTDETVTIVDKAMTLYVANQKRLTRTFTYLPNCGGNACGSQQSTYGCFTTAGEFDIDCQTIVALSATEMTVVQGASGTPIRYRKITSR